ncbi:hypothetical protein, partial [Campylobacter jejuni]
MFNAFLNFKTTLPKQNGYQTIHTTLFDAKSIIEAQIRTFDMHKIAEF